jgi:hypothetical protein
VYTDVNKIHIITKEQINLNDYIIMLCTLNGDNIMAFNNHNFTKDIEFYVNAKNIGQQ